VRPQVGVSVAAVVAVDLVRLLINRRPSKARMKGHDSAERPSSSDLFRPTVATAKDHRLPDAKDLERLVDVEIRPAVGVCRIIEIRIREYGPELVSMLWAHVNCASAEKVWENWCLSPASIM